MSKKEKSLMRQLIEERWIKDAAGVLALVKELTAGMIQGVLISYLPLFIVITHKRCIMSVIT